MCVCRLCTVYTHVHADESLSQVNVAVTRPYIQHYQLTLRGLISHAEVCSAKPCTLYLTQSECMRSVCSITLTT